MNPTMNGLLTFLRRRFAKGPVTAVSNVAILASGPTPTLADDAFHFQEFANSPNAFWYTEWWYFNFIDESLGLSGIMTIACFNPANQDHLGVGMLTLCLVDSKTGVLPPAVEYYPISEFSANATTPNISLTSRNNMLATSETTFSVKGAAKDGSSSIDFTYTSADQPFFLAQNVHNVQSLWEVSSWLSYMPCARVTGTIVSKGKTIALQNARGYHDHDWGMWHEYARTWSWAAYFSPDKQLGFDFGFNAAFQESIAYLRVGDVRDVIKDGSFKFEQSDWKRWMLFWKYPRRMSYEGTTSSGLYKVTLNWTVRDTIKLWRQALIVFEQTAWFTGEVRTLADNKLVATIDEPGFCEYTGLWY